MKRALRPFRDLRRACWPFLEGRNYGIPIQGAPLTAHRPRKPATRTPCESRRGHTDLKGPEAFQDTTGLHTEPPEGTRVMTSHPNREHESQTGPETLPGTQQCSSPHCGTNQPHATHPRGATDSSPTSQAPNKDSTRSTQRAHGPQGSRSVPGHHGTTCQTFRGPKGNNESPKQRAGECKGP